MNHKVVEVKAGDCSCMLGELHGNWCHALTQQEVDALPEVDSEGLQEITVKVRPDLVLTSRADYESERELRLGGVLLHGVSRNDIQSVAEAVHLAIKLLEDAVKEDDQNLAEFKGIFLKARIKSVIPELKPAMMILAPYMPGYVEPEKEFSEQDAEPKHKPYELCDCPNPRPGKPFHCAAERGANLQDSSHEIENKRVCEGCKSPDVHGDSLNTWCDDCLEAGEWREIDEAERGYLDGGDEKSYAERHA